MDYGLWRHGVWLYEHWALELENDKNDENNHINYKTMFINNL